MQNPQNNSKGLRYSGAAAEEREHGGVSHLPGRYVQPGGGHRVYQDALPAQRRQCDRGADLPDCPAYDCGGSSSLDIFLSVLSVALLYGVRYGLRLMKRRTGKDGEETPPEKLNSDTKKAETE